MKGTLEKLWSEYLFDECNVIDTSEERRFAKIICELHEKLNGLLNEEQKTTLEKYVEVLYEVESQLLKKSFIKGCEFSVSFLVEALGDKK